VFVVQAGWVYYATSSATRASMARTVGTSADARMAPPATQSLASATAPLAGRASSVTRSARRANMVQTVQRPVTAKMEPLVTISQACAPAHLAMLVPLVPSRAQRVILVASVSTSATVSTPTLTGATTRQEGVCASRAGRGNDATLLVRLVGGERAAQRSASVSRALATNILASVNADVEESDHRARSAVPLDSLATAARKAARLVAVLLPTAPATLSQEVAFALPA